MALNDPDKRALEAERDAALDRVYQAGPREEPPARLDAAIRAAARREVGARPRPVSRLRAWRVPVSIAAMLVLSVSLVTLMREEGGEELVHPGPPAGRTPPAAPPAPETQTPAASVPAPARPPAGESAAQPRVSKDSGRELQPGSVAGARDAAGAAADPAVSANQSEARGAAGTARTPPVERPLDDATRAPAAPAESRARASVAPSAADVGGGLAAESQRPAPAVPAAKSAERKSAPRSESEPPGDLAAELPRPAPAAPAPLARQAPPAKAAEKAAPRRDDRYGELGATRGPAGASAPAAEPSRRAEADARLYKREQAPVLSPPVAAMAKELDTQPPEKWLARVEELRREGRMAEAEELLAELKRRFPGHR
jgi:hypothetical protein